VNILAEISIVGVAIHVLLVQHLDVIVDFMSISRSKPLFLNLLDHAYFHMIKLWEE